MTTQLKLYNTLTRTKEPFTPIDANNVRMYVCGPTVYDFAHIGNARPVIVFDVLYRLLRHVYGENHVTYVRNITDVDDKINARALRDFPDLPLNDAIRKVTEKTANQFHEDVKALGCLEPTHEPRATEHIDGMVKIIQQLLDNGNAYVTSGGEGREVLFAVGSMADYGKLSGRKLEDQQPGARIAVEAHKRNAGDFVLWKESAADQPGWHGAFTENGVEAPIYGRPGWHIECSAMSNAFLGETFDIHGGGLDLIFPHHENEIAQSRCAHGTDVMANVWMHNGFLQVEGKKMSKSDGNFVTIHELLSGVGRSPVPGEVIRLTMLATHYRQPIDFSEGKLNEWRQKLETWIRTFSAYADDDYKNGLLISESSVVPSDVVVEALSDDLNFQMAVVYLDSLAQRAPKDSGAANELGSNLIWLGVFRSYLTASYYDSRSFTVRPDLYDKHRYRLAEARAITLNRYDYSSDIEARTSSLNSLNAEFNSRFPELLLDGISIILDEHGGVSLRPMDNSAEIDDTAINEKISNRLAFLATKNFAEADRIRDELLAQGIQLKDGKDPVTGERVTTWEVKR